MRRSCELVPCRISSSRNSSGTGPRAASTIVADAQDLGVEARMARPAASPRCAASRRATSGDSRSRRAAHRRAGQRQHDVDADRPQQRALARHVRAADDDHARRRRRRAGRRSRTATARQSADGRAPRRRRAGPSSTSSGNGSPGARRRRSPAPPAPRPRRPRAATRRPRARRPRASDRSRPPAAARSSRTKAIGANIMLCVESSHDTSAAAARSASTAARRAVSSDWLQRGEARRA